jgi:hypothetical protein
LQRILTFVSLVFTFIMPIGLGDIGWKMYMINASWDIVVLVLIVCSLFYRVMKFTNQTRLSIGLKPRERHWKKSTRYSRDRNILQFLILS